MSVILHGKTVVITGASSGIGEATAYEFAKHGARLVLVARRAERLAEIAELCRKDHNVEVQCIEADVRNQAQITSLLHDNIGDNAVDVLVNNAGLSRGLDPVQTGDSINWEEMIDTNIKGLLYVTKEVIPLMMENGSGHIVNIGSIAGHEVYPSGNVYCATKHAVDALTKGFRMDLVETPIRVSTIDPGLTETEFSIVRFRGDKEKAKSVYEGIKALSAEDVAEAVEFVVTRDDNFVIAEMVLVPKSQASAMLTIRK